MEQPVVTENILEPFPEKKPESFPENITESLPDKVLASRPIALNPWRLWERWQAWRAEFAAILDPRFHTAEWLDDEVLSGRITLLDTGIAAVLVSVKAYPTGAREVHGMAAAGDMRDIIDTLIPLAEAWGRNKGCTVATIESREGWKRVLEPSGYQPHQLTLRKDL